MIDAQPAELHSFSDDRRDDATERWGVWNHELCLLCGKRLVIVAPADRKPAMLLCRSCDPLGEMRAEMMA